MKPGRYEVTFSAKGRSAPWGGDGSDLASGIYFYRLSVVPTEGRNGHAGRFQEVRKLILLR